MQTLIVEGQNNTSIKKTNPLPVRVTYPTDDTDAFEAQVYHVGATAPKVVKAGTAGKKMRITDVIISSSGAVRISLETTETGPNVVLGPLNMAANSNFEHTFATPLTVNAGYGLNVVPSGSTNVSVYISGYLE